MGPRDILARALLLGGFSFPAVDLQSTDLETAPPQALALASAATLRRDVQERLVGYLRAGGRLLLHGVLPDRDHDGAPCSVLADALHLRVTGRVEGTAHYFPSVIGHGWAAGAGRGPGRLRPTPRGPGRDSRRAGPHRCPVRRAVRVPTRGRRGSGRGDRRRLSVRPRLLAIRGRLVGGPAAAAARCRRW
jgi:hypothetical protein